MTELRGPGNAPVMPELPEVETTVRGLARYLEGERLERVALNRPDMRFPFPDGLRPAPGRRAGDRAGAAGRSTACSTPTASTRSSSISA